MTEHDQAYKARLYLQKKRVEQKIAELEAHDKGKTAGQTVRKVVKETEGQMVERLRAEKPKGQSKTATRKRQAWRAKLGFQPLETIEEYAHRICTQA